MTASRTVPMRGALCPTTQSGYGDSPGSRGTVAAVRRFFLAGSVLCAFAAVSGAVRPSATWSAYLGGAQSSQFTPLDQINLSNVSRLEVAWSFPAGQRSFIEQLSGIWQHNAHHLEQLRAIEKGATWRPGATPSTTIR